MVRLVIKNGDENQFIFDTTVEEKIEIILEPILSIFNGRLKIHRITAEIEELADHGICLPPNMQGLTDDQLVDLKLTDEYGDKNLPSGGYIDCQDDIGRRNGKAPIEKMAEILRESVTDAKSQISKSLVDCNTCLNMAEITQTINLLKGAVTIVYPMDLPEYDPIWMEFNNIEILDGTQASKDVIHVDDAVLWWAGKEIKREKQLKEYLGRNEKCKIIVKLAKKSSGPPSRESVISEDEKRKMMMYYHQKQEQLKKMEQDNDDSYMDSEWANSSSLKGNFQGLSKNVRWR